MARILIIEDEPHNAEAYQEILEGMGYEVTWTETGRAAREQFENYQFDCVLLDAGLPDVDGFQLLEEIHALYPKLPIIMITGFQIAEQLIKLTQPEIFHYLRKPFDLDQLIQLVEEAVCDSPSPQPS